MAEVRPHRDIPDGRRDSDWRRRASVVMMRATRSRWLAMFAIAFAVSWSFHVAERFTDHKIKVTQSILECTVVGVAKAQDAHVPHVQVDPILEACKKQAGKK